MVVLVCAVLASLASGVLAAYGICVAMFGIFRMRARQVTAAETKAPVAGSAGLLEG